MTELVSVLGGHSVSVAIGASASAASQPTSASASALQRAASEVDGLMGELAKAAGSV